MSFKNIILQFFNDNRTATDRARVQEMLDEVKQIKQDLIDLIESGVNIEAPANLNFQMVVNSNNAGTTANNQYLIKTDPSFEYDYDVEWHEQGNDSNTGNAYQLSGDHTITFASPGTYVLKISRIFPAIKHGGGTDAQKVTEIQNWGAIEWKSFNEAFYTCQNMVVTASDTPNLTSVWDMTRAFSNCTAIKTGFSDWDVSSAQTMWAMFANSGIDDDLSGWNMTSVNSIRAMFQGCTDFNSGIGTWNTTSIVDMREVFKDCPSFNKSLSGWNVSNALFFTGMFDGASGFNNGGDPLTWTPISATLMDEMFRDAVLFNQDLSSWNLAAGPNMEFMFRDALSFNNDNDPLTWDVSAVSNMQGLFWGANSFNANISSWDVGSVTNMSNMFRDAASFNQSISSWDVSSVTQVLNMFWGASSFNQDMSGWDLSGGVDLSGMFKEATAFNNGGVALTWNVTGATVMNQMFEGATVFNQDLSSWDVSSVEGMYRMFYNATAFDQDLSAWDFSSVTSGSLGFTEMFFGVTLSTVNYDALLVQLEATNQNNNLDFHGGNSTYTTAGAGETARTALINDHSWSFSDGGGV